MIRSLFLHHLDRLDAILAKVPDRLFEVKLCDDVFSLGENAEVACGFALRGYCPLVGAAVAKFEAASCDGAAHRRVVAQTRDYLLELPEIDQMDPSSIMVDKAGFAQVALPQPDFIDQYILPNLLFHVTLVYLTAKVNGVNLGKQDFDGLHHYPTGFTFQSS